MDISFCDSNKDGKICKLRTNCWRYIATLKKENHNEFGQAWVATLFDENGKCEMDWEINNLK